MFVGGTKWGYTRQALGELLSIRWYVVSILDAFIRPAGPGGFVRVAPSTEKARTFWWRHRLGL